MNKAPRIILLLLILSVSMIVRAVGPKFPSVLTFVPSTSPGVTGYWLYWRTPAGNYVDTQRWPLSTNAASGFDLRVLGLPKGQYFISGSATNATSESDLATEALWDFTNPNKPTNLQVQ